MFFLFRCSFWACVSSGSVSVFRFGYFGFFGSCWFLGFFAFGFKFFSCVGVLCVFLVLQALMFYVLASELFVVVILAWLFLAKHKRNFLIPSLLLFLRQGCAYSSFQLPKPFSDSSGFSRL